MLASYTPISLHGKHYMCVSQEIYKGPSTQSLCTTPPACALVHYTSWAETAKRFSIALVDVVTSEHARRVVHQSSA